jgi:hypothetical protein
MSKHFGGGFTGRSIIDDLNDELNDDFDGKVGKGYSYHKCAWDHPALTVGKFQIWGGSCWEPYFKLGRFDIEIGLDQGMRSTKAMAPWAPNRVERVYFPITDMSVPKDVEEFKLLIEWTCNQLQAGKRIHVGCIGGHGRTGMFFAALVKTMLGEEDAIEYVRKGYCKKAVESSEQVKWLGKHFGIKAAKGYKEGGYYSGGTKTHPVWQDRISGGYGQEYKGTKHYGAMSTMRRNESVKQELIDVMPVKKKGAIWEAESGHFDQFGDGFLKEGM